MGRVFQVQHGEALRMGPGRAVHVIEGDGRAAELTHGRAELLRTHLAQGLRQVFHGQVPP